MAEIEITKLCYHCGGDGIVQYSEGDYECPPCNGTGKFSKGFINIDEIVGIGNTPPSGHFAVKNLYVDSATGKLIVDYDDIPVE